MRRSDRRSGRWRGVPHALIGSTARADRRARRRLARRARGQSERRRRRSAERAAARRPPQAIEHGVRVGATDAGADRRWKACASSHGRRRTREHRVHHRRGAARSHHAAAPGRPATACVGDGRGARRRTGDGEMHPRRATGLGRSEAQRMATTTDSGAASATTVTPTHAATRERRRRPAGSPRTRMHGQGVNVDASSTSTDLGDAGVVPGEWTTTSIERARCWRSPPAATPAPPDHERLEAAQCVQRVGVACRPGAVVPVFSACTSARTSVRETSPTTRRSGAGGRRPHELLEGRLRPAHPAWPRASSRTGCRPPGVVRCVLAEHEAIGRVGAAAAMPRERRLARGGRAGHEQVAAGGDELLEHRDRSPSTVNASSPARGRADAA